MADELELDQRLRDAFQRAAQPGDPAGVADLIRARVAAGDAGAEVTPVGDDIAPGWAPSAVRRLALLWAILSAVVVLLVGLVLVGVAAGWWPGAGAGADAGAVSSPVATATAATESPAPTRTATPTPTATAIPTPVPTAEPEPAPNPEPEPPPAPALDTTPPAIGSVSADPNPAHIYNGPPGTTVTVSTDADAVAVEVSWSGVFTGGPIAASGGAGAWSAWVDLPPPAIAYVTGAVTISVVAIDAAGNRSAPATVTVLVS